MLLIFFMSCAVISRCSADRFEQEEAILRVLATRDLSTSSRSTSNCSNGGILAGESCNCPHPYTGSTCDEFKCVNGISVGSRYDPNSLLFSKPCLCEEGWKGDLCEFRLTSRCNDRGEWKNNKCECIGSFFGDECQYTSRCDFGSIKHGRCICHKSFEGQYCEKIVCYHGYADVRNQSRSCVCPVKYKGEHCDLCAQTGPHILPYPKCVVDFTPNVGMSRKKNTQQVKSRVFIIVGAVSFLSCMAIAMLLLHRWQQRRKNPELEESRRRVLEERKAMLAEAASRSEGGLNKERKRSITNPFKMMRKFSNVERNEFNISMQNTNFSRQVSSII